MGLINPEYFQRHPSLTGFITPRSNLGIALTPTFSAASGIEKALILNPTINQSGTAGYTVLEVLSTESATGSGVRTLAKIGGTDGLTVLRNGNSGYGTNTPIYRMQVAKDVTASDFGSGLIPFAITGKTNTSKTLLLGFETENDYAFIQTLELAVSFSSYDLSIQPKGGNVIIGNTAASGKFHVDQSSASAAIPVQVLDQADLSEEFIEFVSTVGVGNPIEAVGAKSLTTTHFIRVSIDGVGMRYMPVGTIA